MSVRTRRAHPGRRAVAQPSSARQRQLQDQASWNPNVFVNTDLGMAPTFQNPRDLHLAMPGTDANDYGGNDWLGATPHDDMQLTSPTDTEPFSPTSADSFRPLLPVYQFPDAHIQEANFPTDYKPYAVPDQDVKFDPFVNASSSYMVPAPVTATVEPGQLTGDSSSPPSYAQGGAPRQRSAHRKAIEEKSSIKRKNAESRLSNAITARLGGTFVPGLANQLNQAADLLEKDHGRIHELEQENRMLLAQLRR